MIIHILVSLIIILIGLTVFLFITKRRLWLKLNRIEQQLILSKTNPHFIFNSLTAIQSYIFRNDPLQAGKYLSIFAKLIRLIIECSRLELIPIEKEVRILRLYFELQALRFEGKFDFNIEVDDALEIDKPIIPPMLAQPFIESSTEHGFIQLLGKGIITVRFIKQKGEIVIEVEDNGIGIDESELGHLRSRKSHQALATEITSERIKKIWQINRLKIRMENINLNSVDSTKQGSIVKLIIPANY